ncbi:MAG: ABC transporter ATP-binding protein [Anaerolineae bacterium]|nr:ABC transporter ATP-binding protein [Anaerolineae bacterium]
MTLPAAKFACNYSALLRSCLSRQKENLVEVQDLKVWFPVQKNLVERMLTREHLFVHAVDGVSFEIRRGEVFGLAGESGSGKTTTGRAIVRLEKPTDGRVWFEGEDTTHLDGEPLRLKRQRMQVIFQDPYASLNPRMSIGDAIGHSLEIFGVAMGEEKRVRVMHMMERVGLTPMAPLYEKFPHQLSGGQRQRAVMARALIMHPDLIVTDEPIAMADVSMRALLLQLMMDLKDESDLTYLFITHDLATAKYICDRIAVMYLGKIVEMGTLQQVYSDPKHPYTQALLAAVPDPKARRTAPMPRGEIPSPIDPPLGCRFHPRCPIAEGICSKEIPLLEPIAGQKEHLAACHLVE